DEPSWTVREIPIPVHGREHPTSEPRLRSYVPIDLFDQCFLRIELEEDMAWGPIRMRREANRSLLLIQPYARLPRRDELRLSRHRVPNKKSVRVQLSRSRGRSRRRLSLRRGRPRIRNRSPKRHPLFRRISPINPRSWELASQPREERLPDPLPLVVRIHLQPVDPNVVPVLLESQRS